MKILLLAAMDKEINLILNQLQQSREINEKGIIYWKGKIGSHEVFVSKCGIGKVNSALNTYKFLEILKPELVINSGVAGGAGSPIGEVVVAERVAYHDVWCGPGTEYGQADGLPLFMKPSESVLRIAERENFTTGLICSGDKFISTPAEIQFIKSKFPCVSAVDMESASVGQTCEMCGTPFAIIRVVSDTPGEGENISQYKDFWDAAPKKTFDVITKILNNLK